MTNINLAFGDKIETIEIPEENISQILSPTQVPPLENLSLAIENSLDNPIGQEPLENWIKPGDKVLLISDDNTRLTPVDKILPPLLKRLNEIGVMDDQISCIMALGTHRYMSDEEMIQKVGKGMFEKIHVFNHEWQDKDTLVNIGNSKTGIPLWINKAALEADVIIGLGAIVPHHIPGFSGSSKIIQPGICGPITTAHTHMLSCQGGGDSFLGIEKNAVRHDLDDMADKVGLNTIFNVVMNPKGEVSGTFFGEKRKTFHEGVQLSKKIYGVNYTETPDIVLSNSNPCEIDFWQSHKSLYPAQRMVKPGGTIIICTPAPEGISPVHNDLLNFTSWPSEKIRDSYTSGKIKNGVAAALATAWAITREKANVIMHSPGIPVQDKIALGFTHAETIEDAIYQAFKLQGSNARMAVLTHAPDILPIQTKCL